MDALKGIIANVPDWIKRLDDLSSQIDQRQLELARFVEPGAAASSASGIPSRTKSVRNRGSTESLKPKDEGAAWKDDGAGGGQQAGQPGPTVPASSPTSPGPGERPRQALAKQTTQVAEAGQTRARATLRKRNKRSDSVASAERKPKYRTRSMIIVYYDSYVQSFFEELVKFVSAQRNLIRKAKMAAKVAHIKRMAELEIPSAGAGSKDSDALAICHSQQAGDDSANKLVPDMGGPVTVGPKLEADDTEPATAETAAAAAASPLGAVLLPELNYRRTLNMRSPGMLASGRPMYLRASGREAHIGGAAAGASGMSPMGSQKTPDVYDELDRALEYVQSMCEHAAHQFLRDGDCNEEIDNIKRRLGEAKKQADHEMERVEKEEPEALKALEEPPKSRSFRPQSMRRDALGNAPGAKEGLLAIAPIGSGPQPSAAGAIEVDAELQVDEGIDGMHETPRLTYKSSRR